MGQGLGLLVGLGRLIQIVDPSSFYRFARIARIADWLQVNQAIELLPRRALAFGRLTCPLEPSGTR